MKKNKFIATMLALALVVTGVVQFGRADNSLPFTDVPNTHWAYSYIKSLYEDGITNGVQKNRFGVNEPLAARQFIVMLARAEFEDKIESSESSAWDTPSIEYFNENGFYEGTAYEGRIDNPYAFTSSIKRSDMAKLVYNILKSEGKLPTKYSASYSDVYDNIEIYAAISETGILTGYADGTFKPDKYLTRAEGSVVVKRLVDYLAGEDVKTENKKNAEATKIAKDGEAKVQPETKVVNVENYLVKNSLVGTSLEGSKIEISDVPSLVPGGGEIHTMIVNNAAGKEKHEKGGVYVDPVALFNAKNGEPATGIKGTLYVYTYDNQLVVSDRGQVYNGGLYAYNDIYFTPRLYFTVYGNTKIFEDKEEVFYFRFISDDKKIDISVPCQVTLFIPSQPTAMSDYYAEISQTFILDI